MDDPIHEFIPMTTEAIDRFDVVQRREWAKARATALERWEKSRGILEADERNALETLEAAQRRAREVIATAMAAYRDSNRKRIEAEQARDAIVGPAEASLRATASEKIRAFADRLERRRRNLDVRNEFTVDKIYGERCVATSAESVREVSLHIAQVIQRSIPELELLPVDEMQLEKRIAEIEADIPEPEMRPIRVK